MRLLGCNVFFFFNDTATTEIYTLSLHDALPILRPRQQIPRRRAVRLGKRAGTAGAGRRGRRPAPARSEEHTSELQSLAYLVCRLLLEKKKPIKYDHYNPLHQHSLSA